MVNARDGPRRRRVKACKRRRPPSEAVADEGQMKLFVFYDAGHDGVTSPRWGYPTLQKEKTNVK